MTKRVSFERGLQKKFIKNLKNKTGLKWRSLSNKLKVKESTLTKSYMFELCDLPYKLFKEIVRLLDEDENKILKDYKAKVREDTLVIGRKCFGEQKKVLDPIKITFKNNDIKLDITRINYSKYDLERSIKLPDKLTPELAEEIGMQFGDGFLSKKRYDYRLKGNPNDEKEYYQNYIKHLFKKLFNVEVNLKESYNSYGFELRSKAIWEFKTKVLGIKPGKKYNIRLPEILKIKNVEIVTAFIRGLFDTDGSLNFKTRYGYYKYYPSIELTLTSKELIKEVGEILSMLGFDPSVIFNKRYGRIFIYGIGALKRYEELIGWSSQKNLNKLKDWKDRYPELDSSKMAVVVQWQNTRLWSARRGFDSLLPLSKSRDV